MVKTRCVFPTFLPSGLDIKGCECDGHWITHHKWHDIECGDVVILIWGLQTKPIFALLGVQIGGTLAIWVDKRWQKGHKLPSIILDLGLRP